MSATNYDLFGGAVKVQLPAGLIDASTLRQVPDTQEVFLYPHSNISIIVEVLERVEPADFPGAVRFHFESLAHDNTAVSKAVDDINVIPNDRGDDTPSAVVLTGRQQVAKFNRTILDTIQILMALYRVESKNVDLVVTFNIPVASHDGGAIGETERNAAKTDFENMVRSLRIVDFGLFVQE